MRLTEEQYAELLHKRGVPSRQPNAADTSNPPFAPVDMMIELPPPISVNSSRRVDWKQRKKTVAWMEIADKFLEVGIARGEIHAAKLARYELHITLSEDHTKIDADNGLKLLIDYLRHRDITANDGKKQMRRVTVEWGYAPAGCKILIKPLPGSIKDVLRRAEGREWEK